MLPISTLTLYNASAGSGKTYILVKEYLVLVFKNPFAYKSILVVTFTNKAALEIQERIILHLKNFSKNSILEKKDFLFETLASELDFSFEDLHKKAKELLGLILHDFSNFSISTIDKFTYKILSSFFKYEQNQTSFNLEFNKKKILTQAIEVFLSRLDEKFIYRDFLTHFSLKNIEENKTWDPTYRLINIAYLLTKEENFDYVEKLEKYNLENFNELAKKLKEKKDFFEKNLFQKASVFFSILERFHIKEKSFIYQDLPRFFRKIQTKKISSDLFRKRLQENITQAKFYSKNCDPVQKEFIDENSNEFQFLYRDTKDFYEAHFSEFALAKILSDNFFSMALLLAIEKELENIKRENKILFGSELNKKISHQIRQLPLPFIYEKLGEKYEHYFIDEFQDTSILQWENLELLVENSLSQGGSALILGDAKQSIYRWRAGEVEQFIDLTYKPSPYLKNIKNLSTNYRSFPEIINFNNSFYLAIIEFLKNPYYEKIYKESLTQNTIKKEGGYVELNFIDSDKHYNENTYKALKEKIETLKSQGYKYNEMAILVRKNKEASFLANQFGLDKIPVYSSEGLLLKNSWQAKFLITFFKLLLYPKNPSFQVKIALFLVEREIIKINKELHEFLYEISCISQEEFFEKIKNYGIFASVNDFYYANSLYELTKLIIDNFLLKNKEDQAPLFTFLDFVFENRKQFGNSIENFFTYWESEKEGLSLNISNQEEAIEILSIHKSKGLEFPVVLFPFASWNCISEYGASAWLDLEDKEFGGFENFHVKVNENLKHAGNKANELYEESAAKFRFDNLNLLYVATTRAIEQLIIFSEKKEGVNKNVSFYFEEFLKSQGMWQEDKSKYSFGNSKKIDFSIKESIAFENLYLLENKKLDFSKFLFRNKEDK